jgi:hypothetical protein
MLADNLTATAPHIVVARLNCEEAERFCNDDIRISRTPEFKVRSVGDRGSRAMCCGITTVAMPLSQQQLRSCSQG